MSVQIWILHLLAVSQDSQLHQAMALVANAMSCMSWDMGEHCHSYCGHVFSVFWFLWCIRTSNLCLRNDLKSMGSQVVLMELCNLQWFSEQILEFYYRAAATVGIVLAQRATATAIDVACVLTAKIFPGACLFLSPVHAGQAKCGSSINNLYISGLPFYLFWISFPSGQQYESVW